MLSKFSDNLRMFQGKRKRQIAENVYIIEGKCKLAARRLFLKFFLLFQKFFFTYAGG